jgi:hypothetical protein
MLDSMTLDRALGPRCNIGPEETARRRRSATAMTVFAAAVAVVLVGTHVPPVARLAIWPFAAAAAVNWLQVVHRFCVAFGALGIENFGPLGGQVPVDPATRTTDRRRALQLIVEGSLIGLVVAIAVVALPA